MSDEVYELLVCGLTTAICNRRHLLWSVKRFVQQFKQAKKWIS